jgi:F-type H+-transporting ATPase subunit a
MTGASATVQKASEQRDPLPPEEREGGKEGLSTKAKVGIGFGILALLIGVTYLATGSAGRNNEYKPQEEFKLTPWIEIKIGALDLSINKAVFYLLLATALTCWVMIYIAKRMADRPNRVQTTVEAAYDLTYNNITRGNMDEKMAAKWFPFVATLFFFIWFSNMIGYIPLPTNTMHKVSIFGLELPALALYAATANLSVPLVLTLVVWFSYHVEGVRAKGFGGYLASWVPAGVTGFAKYPIFVIEAISHFVRIISLSVRLFANILAGHLLILFMGGGLVVLLGLAAVGWLTVPLAFAFFLFEVGLVATLQAFIFATLTSIYLGGAVAAEH